jgi:hypothetical protein
MTEVKNPTHGFTKHGLAVHAKIMDHMRDDTAYQRFNKKVALALTKNVGTMTAFWIISHRYEYRRNRCRFARVD